jgi:hypothetical protein
MHTELRWAAWNSHKGRLGKKRVDVTKTILLEFEVDGWYSRSEPRGVGSFIISDVELSSSAVRGLIYVSVYFRFYGPLKVLIPHDMYFVMNAHFVFLGALFNYACIVGMPNTVAARSKAWSVFARSNAGIVGLNSTQGMNACIYSVFVLYCAGSSLASGWSSVQGVLPTV